MNRSCTDGVKDEPRIKYPVRAYPPSKDTGSILILDANNDCVCMADDVATAAEIVERINATFRVRYDSL